LTPLRALAALLKSVRRLVIEAGLPPALARASVEHVQAFNER
jgi:hypothetical protein